MHCMQSTRAANVHGSWLWQFSRAYSWYVGVSDVQSACMRSGYVSVIVTHKRASCCTGGTMHSAARGLAQHWS